MVEEKRWISSNDLFLAIGELLAENKQAVFTITGNSMWPFLAHGRDQVVVEKSDVSKLKKGDIVLFKTIYGNYILHRITKLMNHQFESTGDGLCQRDGSFELDCIEAKVVILIRKGKTINCNSLFWKFIFKCWMFLFPMRKYIIYWMKKVIELKT